MKLFRWKSSTRTQSHTIYYVISALPYATSTGNIEPLCDNTAFDSATGRFRQPLNWPTYFNDFTEAKKSLLEVGTTDDAIYFVHVPKGWEKNLPQGYRTLSDFLSTQVTGSMISGLVLHPYSDFKTDKPFIKNPGFSGTPPTIELPIESASPKKPTISAF